MQLQEGRSRSVRVGETLIPTYVLKCHNGHVFERYLRFENYDTPQECPGCGELSERQICAPMVFVSQDINYGSPIDGRAITSKQARLEDLARSGCIPYEEGMRQDYDRRVKESDEQLDKSVDATVEKAVSEMPSRKREKLTAELQGGLTAESVRITPAQQSMRGTT